MRAAAAESEEEKEGRTCELFQIISSSHARRRKDREREREGKKLKQVRCPPGEKRRRKERIDTNEGGKGSNVESTWQEERMCRDFRLIGHCLGNSMSYYEPCFTKIGNESGTKCETSRRGVILSVHYCALRHCALFYVRYYRLGAAGDDARRRVFGKRGDLLNTNECSSMNSKVPPHHTTTQQREEDVSIHGAGKEVFLHIKALKRRF